MNVLTAKINLDTTGFKERINKMKALIPKVESSLDGIASLINSKDPDFDAAIEKAGQLKSFLQEMKELSNLLKGAGKC